jgi:hypothetical protein
MCFERIEWIYDTSDPPVMIGVRVYGVGDDGLLEVLFADIGVHGNRWNQNRLNKFIERGQELLDHRIPLTDPSLVGDPAALTDPAQDNFFWDDGDLVARSVLLTDVRISSDVLHFSLEQTG